MHVQQHEEVPPRCERDDLVEHLQRCLAAPCLVLRQRPLWHEWIGQHVVHREREAHGVESHPHQIVEVGGGWPLPQPVGAAGRALSAEPVRAL